MPEPLLLSKPGSIPPWVLTHILVLVKLCPTQTDNTEIPPCKIVTTMLTTKVMHATQLTAVMADPENRKVEEPQVPEADLGPTV